MGDEQLAYEMIGAPDALGLCYFLHGIFGTGRNWASIARRVSAARPEWGAVLVDLRGHGSSPRFAPPHTLAAAAEDVVRLIERVGKPAAVVGHSFGGKVALTLGEARPDWLRALFVIDSTPEAGAPRGDAWGMLGVVRRLPPDFATRDEAVRAMRAEGVAEPIARWFAMNLSPSEGRQRWRLDFSLMEALLLDFFQHDRWAVLEENPPERPLVLVKAEGAEVLSEAAASRVEAISAWTPSVTLRRVPGGHWLNADNPEAMISLLVDGLPTLRR